jgi:predicted nucleic acid-binding protein
MYLDSAYIAKFYVNERDSGTVRDLIRTANVLLSSAWATGEVVCAFHRHLREGCLSPSQFRQLRDAFLNDVEAGLWTLLPVDAKLLRRTALLIGAAPTTVYLRAGDAVHLATVQDAGEREIWTNDRHLLAAAAHFGIAGRSA